MHQKSEARNRPQGILTSSRFDWFCLCLLAALMVELPTSLEGVCVDAEVSGRGRGMWDEGLFSKSGSLPLPRVFWLVVPR